MFVIQEYVEKNLFQPVAELLCPWSFLLFMNFFFIQSHQVSEVLRSHSSVGMRHRDHSTTGNTLKHMSTGLTRYFFGSKHDQKLTVHKFLDFQRQLMTEILKLEVNIVSVLSIPVQQHLPVCSPAYTVFKFLKLFVIIDNYHSGFYKC